MSDKKPGSADQGKASNTPRPTTDRDSLRKSSDFAEAPNQPTIVLTKPAPKPPKKE